jgi:tetratricopeptide (TPR) repeat protein
MRKLIVLVCILFCVSTAIVAQTGLIDSARIFVDTSKNEWEVTNKLLLLTELTWEKDTLIAKQYLDKAFALAKRRKDNNNIAHYYLIKSQQAERLTDFNKALLWADTSIIYFNKGISTMPQGEEKDKALLNRSSAFSAKGAALNQFGKSEEAIKIYLLAIEDWEKTSLPEKYHGMAIITGNIAAV